MGTSQESMIFPIPSSTKEADREKNGLTTSPSGLETCSQALRHCHTSEASGQGWSSAQLCNDLMTIPNYWTNDDDEESYESYD